MEDLYKIFNIVLCVVVVFFCKTFVAYEVARSPGKLRNFKTCPNIYKS